ncbi:sulfite exporter TauE/SafE family protein [Patescibacteria group bacterium]
MTEILIISIAIFIGFSVQTTAGFAATLASAPILLLIMPLPEAMAVLSILLLIFSIILVPQVWKKINKKICLEMALIGLIGLYFGTVLLKYGNPLFLKKAFGLFVLIYVIYSFLHKEKIKWINKVKIPFAALGGLFSGLFSSGGPFFIIYINNLIKDHKKIRATIIGIFGIINFARVPLLVQNKILTWELFIKSLYAIPALLLGCLVGHYIFKKMPQKTFKTTILVLLFISGISLIIK